MLAALQAEYSLSLNCKKFSLVEFSLLILSSRDDVQSIDKHFYARKVDIECVRGTKFIIPDQMTTNIEVAEVLMGILKRDCNVTCLRWNNMFS